MTEKHEFMKVCGYEFVKIGTFYNAEKFGTKKYPDYNLAIKLVDKELLNAEKSTYLITEEINNEPKIIYVGYYSHSPGYAGVLRGWPLFVFVVSVA